MPITLHDILPLKSFSKITLLTNEKGLDRSVSWPYCAQTEDIAPWVHGHELIFITGIMHDENMLSLLLDVCVEKHLAGLVVLVGEEYITHVPDSIIQRANNLQIPLFSMPYHVKLLEVTKEISDIIIRDKLKSEQEQNILNTWLFSENFDMSTVSSTLPSQLSLENFCGAILFHIPQSLIDNALIESTQRHMYALFLAASLNVSFSRHENTIICMLFASTKEKALQDLENIEQLALVLSQNHFENKLIYGIGKIYALAEMRKSYAEAKTVVNLALRLNNFKITRFTELGFYYFLSQSENLQEKYQYYQEYLEPILAYDKENNATLLPTLHAYLLCNGNVAKTAQKIFLHRNTLLYRLNQIRDLTQMDLDDAITRMNYLNAIILREYLLDVN